LSRWKQISSFTNIGLCDPTKETSHKFAVRKMKELMLEDEVYGESLDTMKPPKCIFLPDPKLCRRMIKAVLKFKENESKDAFLMKFGLMQRKY
jgi:hypothetical protein